MYQLPKLEATAAYALATIAPARIKQRAEEQLVVVTKPKREAGSTYSKDGTNSTIKSSA